VNFVPGVNLQRGIRLGNWYPRFTLSGPLKKGRAWFSDALTLEHNVRVFTELPQNADTIDQRERGRVSNFQFLQPVRLSGQGSRLARNGTQSACPLLRMLITRRIPRQCRASDSVSG